ncbi:MAG: threonylcarbamoyl-AMP synthase [Paramuribaculum sp.]|nr:threonylcarbamoyl-AMP synthase [Paramuribaculum sp.]
MIDREDIDACVASLRRGGVIVYPTDTVWGIGCDATDSAAVRRVFEIKRRADAKALISLVSDEAMLERWVDDIPEVAFELIEAAVNPMTIVYDHPAGLAPELLAEDGSAAIRVTADPFCCALCRALRKPLVSTSANISGSPAPRSYAQISAEILESADYVALTRREDSRAAKPSTVIKLGSGGLITVIRK